MSVNSTLSLDEKEEAARRKYLSRRLRKQAELGPVAAFRTYREMIDRQACCIGILEDINDEGVTISGSVVPWEGIVTVTGLDETQRDAFAEEDEENEAEMLIGELVRDVHRDRIFEVREVDYKDGEITVSDGDSWQYFSQVQQIGGLSHRYHIWPMDGRYEIHYAMSGACKSVHQTEQEALQALVDLG